MGTDTTLLKGRKGLPQHASRCHARKSSSVWKHLDGLAATSWAGSSLFLTIPARLPQRLLAEISFLPEAPFRRGLTAPRPQ